MAHKGGLWRKKKYVDIFSSINGNKVFLIDNIFIINLRGCI